MTRILYLSRTQLLRINQRHLFYQTWIVITNPNLVKVNYLMRRDRIKLTINAKWHQISTKTFQIHTITLARLSKLKLRLSKAYQALALLWCHRLANQVLKSQARGRPNQHLVKVHSRTLPCDKVKVCKEYPWTTHKCLRWTHTKCRRTSWCNNSSRAKAGSPITLQLWTHNNGTRCNSSSKGVKGSSRTWPRCKVNTTNYWMRTANVE